MGDQDKREGRSTGTIDCTAEREEQLWYIEYFYENIEYVDV